MLCIIILCVCLSPQMTNWWICVIHGFAKKKCSQRMQILLTLMKFEDFMTEN